MLVEHVDAEMSVTPSPKELQPARDLRMSLLKDPDHQQKMMSKTLWKHFGVKAKNKMKVAKVAAALAECGIDVLVDDTFGRESKDSWIVLRLLDGPTWPTEDWFHTMQDRKFTTEREVEYFFAMRLLERLGYRDCEFALQHPLIVHQGSSAKKMKADIVIFPEGNRNGAALVVEVKNNNFALKPHDFGQAKSYAIELHAPLYLVTNGDDSRLMELALKFSHHAELLAFQRSQIEQQWPELVEHLSRDAVIAYKKRLQAQL